jgi:hypothetical protein
MTAGFKECAICNAAKNRECFYDRSDARDGKRNECKDCIRARSKILGKKYYQNNRGRIDEKNKKWRKVNGEKSAIIKRRCRIKNKHKTRSYEKKYRAENKEKTLAITRKSGNKHRNNLQEGYMIKLLMQKGFTKDQAKSNPKIIEVQRLLVRVKRLIKTKAA